MAGFLSGAGLRQLRKRLVVPTAARGAVGGGVVAFVACLLAAELLLGIAQPGHAARAVLLTALLFSTVALAGMLHPGKRTVRSVRPAKGIAS